MLVPSYVKIGALLFKIRTFDESDDEYVNMGAQEVKLNGSCASSILQQKLLGILLFLCGKHVGYEIGQDTEVAKFIKAITPTLYSLLQENVIFTHRGEAELQQFEDAFAALLFESDVAIHKDYRSQMRRLEDENEGLKKELAEAKKEEYSPSYPVDEDKDDEKPDYAKRFHSQSRPVRSKYLEKTRKMLYICFPEQVSNPDMCNHSDNCPRFESPFLPPPQRW